MVYDGNWPAFAAAANSIIGGNSIGKALFHACQGT
jgi:hypothetical protein